MKLYAIICLAIVSCLINQGEGRAFSKKNLLKIDLADLPPNPQEFYLKAQDFFNSIFGDKLQIQVTNQETIKGLITFKGVQKISEGSVVYVSIIDISKQDASSVKIAESIYNNPKSFPIEFNVPFNRESINLHGLYTISVAIKEKNGLLRYISDTRTDIIDAYGNIIKYPVLIMVVDVSRPIPNDSNPGFVEVPVPSPPMLARIDKIKGLLVCSSKKCLEKQLNNQTLIISIKDVSLMDAPSKTLVLKEIFLSSGWKFPLNYEIEFDSTKIYEDSWRTFSISAVMNDPITDKLTFISDTRHEIIDRSVAEPSLFKNIDINIVAI